jgi:D-alanine-D-alanine ligase-like ATP-grasp enzyme
VGLNSGAAVDVVKDKAYTKYFLQLGGVSCATGQAFLLSWWAQRLRRSLSARGLDQVRDVAEAVGYARDVLGFPVYIKPADGSKGWQVWCVAGEEELAEVIARYERERVRVALIEERIELPDFRLVVLDGEVISAYQRVPLSVTGDAVSTVEQLLVARQDGFHVSGRDVSLWIDDDRVTARLRRLGLNRSTVPAAGAVVQLLDASNLSLGGESVDVTGKVAARWSQLAVDVAAMFGLRFCGVDLACADLTSDAGPYAVIEVNGTPGLDQYGLSGERQERFVRELYARVLNTAPEHGRRLIAEGFTGPEQR